MFFLVFLSHSLASTNSVVGQKPRITFAVYVISSTRLFDSNPQINAQRLRLYNNVPLGSFSFHTIQFERHFAALQGLQVQEHDASTR